MDFCQKCGSSKNLQKHHISYNPENIILLCSDCHHKEHKKSCVIESPNIGLTKTIMIECNRRIHPSNLRGLGVLSISSKEFATFIGRKCNIKCILEITEV